MLSFVFFVFLYFMIFMLSVVFNNYIMWWSIFLILNISFFFLNKIFMNDLSNLYYFIVQELLGFLFLFFVFLNFQWLILMLKIGISPFFFWVFFIVDNLSGIMLFWFLTFQKVPYLPLIKDFFMNFLFFFIFGILIIYFLLFFMKKIKFLVMLNSFESFSWILINLYFSSFNFLTLFFFYSFVFIMFIFLMSKKNKLFKFEFILFVLNLPLMPSFFLKFFSLNFISYNFLFIFFILFFMFFNMMSFIYYYFMFFMKNFNYKKDLNYWWMIMMFIFIFIFCIIKNYYIILMS